MTRYRIVFEDGSEMGVCLDYVPKVGESISGYFLFPRIIATVEVVS